MCVRRMFRTLDALHGLPGYSDGVALGSNQIPVQTIKMGCRQGQAKRVDEHPQQVDNVVAVRRLNQRAGRRRRCALHEIGQCSGDKRRAQVDCYGGEPDHGDAE